MVNSLIYQIFDEHYHSVAQAYKLISRPLFLYFLPLLNYSNNIDNPRMKLYIKDHIPEVFDHIGLFLTHLKMEK